MEDFGIVFTNLITITNMPIIVLRDGEGERILPIWVGVFEANAIALQIENVRTPRPMTHDLVRDLLISVDAKVKKIVVHDLRKNTYYAFITWITAGRRSW